MTGDISKSPFVSYLQEDKSRYKKASECGFVDPDDDFLIGDSGGFLLNWNITDKFVDTHLIRQPALYHAKHGAYHNYPKNSQDYKKWRIEQQRFRREGIKAPILIRNGKLKEVIIPGVFYGYLNFGKIKLTKVDENDKTKSIKRKEEFFPDFWDGDYWVWKIKQFAYNNGFNEIYAKARRKGFTYKEAWDAANEVNLYPKSVVVLAAYEDKYLITDGAIGSFAEKYLDWFETDTQFRRGYLSKNWKTGLKLGFKKKASLIEEGYQSVIWAVTCSANPSAVIGKSGDKIKFEEAGNFPNLNEVLDVTLSVVEDGSRKSGNISIFGTGGHAGSNWTTFSQKFYNPESINAMPFENIWDKGARSNVCGFFFPNILSYAGYMDKDGNSDFMGALTYDTKDKARQQRIEKDPTRLSIYIGQRANSPQEAFKQVTEHVLSSPELITHVAKISNDDKFKFYRDGILQFDNKTQSGVRFISNEELEINQATKSMVHPFIEDVPFKKSEDLTGCIREYAPPIVIDGQIPSNLYRIYHDPFGVDVEKDKLTAQHSLQATFVYMRPNNLSAGRGDTIVASYVGRPSSSDEVNDVLLKLCYRYNAQLLFERNRGDTGKYFQQKKQLQYLIKEPTIIHDKVKEAMSGNYGINITKELKLKGIVYLRDWLYEEINTSENGVPTYRFEKIYDVPFLKECIIFDGTQNVDRISAMLLGMFDKKEQLIKELKIINPIKKNNNNYFKRQLF